MKIDEEQTEDTKMQNEERDKEQQRSSFHSEGALAQQTAMQR